ncbi:MAG: polysaccharide deacetylase family protein [Nocardioidaceae bacterium]
MAVQCLPALTSFAPARRALLPTLSGIGGTGQIALTYDDGPDPASTPLFLELLGRSNVRATFFLLGEYVAPNAKLVKEMDAQGHELAVHGWDHRCLAAKLPGKLARELARTKQLIEDLTGKPVLWYRPPYGVMTTEGILAARRSSLRTMLWSSWGRDWSARATPTSVVGRANSVLRPGGTLLLHDTDRTSAPGSWRNSLAASATLLAHWAQQGTVVGPLREHPLIAVPLYAPRQAI